MKIEKNTLPNPTDNDKMGEVELIRLMRQFRIMEGDRVAFAEETGSKLRKQRVVIDNLKKEKQNLALDLKLATCEQNKIKDEAVVRKIKELLNERQQYIDEIKIIKNQINEIKYQIRKVEKELDVLKKQEQSDGAMQQEKNRLEKNVEIFENRLDVAMKRFNTTLAENEKLRQEIDHLLKERSVFNHLWQSLISNLNKGKKFMLDLVEQATIAYDQRDEWCSKLQALKERGRADLTIHTQEMRELQRKRDHGIKLREFLGIKGQKRILDDLSERVAKKQLMQKEKMEEQLSLYNQLLEQIKTYANENDIERLAQQFIKQEEENFAYFNYVNELNQEIESLNDSVHELRKKIDEQKELNETREQNQKSILEKLEEELRVNTEEADAAEEQYEQLEEILKKTLEGIEELFIQVRADNSPLLKLLGENAHVNSHNAHLYLKILEKRTTDLISISFNKDKSEFFDKNKKELAAIRLPSRSLVPIILAEKMVETHPCPLCVEVKIVSDVIENVQDPLDLETAIMKLKPGLGTPRVEKILHNVSACNLPASRKILQKRFL